MSGAHLVLHVRTHSCPTRRASERRACSGETGESVLYLGHWDHLGICRPESAKDRICNGAVDNASGIAMLIEIARAVADGPRPVRELRFMGTTAEEMGLLVAEYVGAHPTGPPETLVAAIHTVQVAIA